MLACRSLRRKLQRLEKPRSLEVWPCYWGMGGLGKIRNGSILYGSTRVISGALTQIQTLAYRWTHGSHTWSRPSKFPKAYSASSTDPSDRCWHERDQEARVL